MASADYHDALFRSPRRSSGALATRARQPAFGVHAYGSHAPSSGQQASARTARDLQREIKSRAKRRSGVHKPVLEQLRRRIESKAALDHVRMVYRVPEFIPGLPRYEVADVAYSIADALADDGFIVEVYEPDTLYVSWDKAEAKRGDRKGTGAGQPPLPYDAAAVV